MGRKQEITETDLETEEAKELELDEQPKPTRKISHPNVPVPDIAESSTMDRKIKKKEKKDKEVKAKKSGFKTSNADLSMDILDIMTNGM